MLLAYIFWLISIFFLVYPPRPVLAATRAAATAITATVSIAITAKSARAATSADLSYHKAHYLNSLYTFHSLHYN